MKFEEADDLCSRIIEFMREQGEPYQDADESYLEWVVLTALATGQYELKEDAQGLVYFICWWWLDKEQIEAVLTEQAKPESVCGGPYLYVADCVARKGHGVEMTRNVKRLFKDYAASIYWHRTKKNGKLSSFNGRQ